MLIDERLMIYGRGTTGNGYAGALAAPSGITLSSVNASVAPTGASPSSSTTLASTSWVVVAPDAGDLLGTNGTSMHEGPATTAASVSVTSGQVIKVAVGTDSVGAVGYNLYVGSVSSGPFYYAGRTGYNTGYIQWQPTTGPSTTSGASDGSAVATNYDGLITNTAASGGYVTRLNATLSTSNPGTEFQTAFGSLYESVKGDPEIIWMNGFDRLQLSNAILNSSNVNAYRVFIQDSNVGNTKAGTVVQSLMNEVTGSEVPITVHPWFPCNGGAAQQCAAA